MIHKLEHIYRKFLQYLSFPKDKNIRYQTNLVTLKRLRLINVALSLAERIKNKDLKLQLRLGWQSNTLADFRLQRIATTPQF